MTTSGYRENNESEKKFALGGRHTECSRWVDLLHTRVDLLSEEELADLQAHLDECQECHDEYTFTQKLFLTIEYQEPLRDMHTAARKRQELFAYYEELYGQSPSVPLSLAETPVQLSPSRASGSLEEELLQPANNRERKNSKIVSFRSSLLADRRASVLLARSVVAKPRAKAPILAALLLSVCAFFLLSQFLSTIVHIQVASVYAMNVQQSPISAVSRELPKQVHPSGWVHTVAWSPITYPVGGRVIALLWSDYVAQVWSVDEKRELFRFEVGWGEGLAFSPDGKYLAALSKEDSTFQVLDVEKCIADPTTCSADADHMFKGHSNWINALSWSPDGKYIASASADDTVSIWNASNAQLMYSYQNPASHSDNDGGSHQYTTVAWSPDGTNIAAGDDMGNVQIWRALDARKPLATYHTPGGVDPLTSVGWSLSSNKGRYLVAAGFRGFAYVWDVETGQLHATLAMQGNPNAISSTNNPIYSAAWSPTMPDVIALASYNTIQFYQDDGTLITKYTLSQNATQAEASNVFTVAWSPDGRQLVVGGQGIVLKITFRKVNS